MSHLYANATRTSWRMGSRRAALPYTRRGFATVQDIVIKPIAGSLGAEIDGVDLRRADEAKIKTIRNAWLKHKVIFLRDQELTSEEYIAFASKIGHPSRYPMVAGIKGFPEITHVLK